MPLLMLLLKKNPEQSVVVCHPWAGFPQQSAHCEQHAKGVSEFLVVELAAKQRLDDVELAGCIALWQCTTVLDTLTPNLLPKHGSRHQLWQIAKDHVDANCHTWR